MKATAAMLEVRALALLGERPLLTLLDPNDTGSGLSVRLWRAGRVWHAVIDDGAALLDRVRMGLRPGFVLHHDGATQTISGEVEVRILGPASAHVDGGGRVGLGDHPFGLARGVLVECAPLSLALEPVIEGESGAVPRT